MGRIRSVVGFLSVVCLVGASGCGGGKQRESITAAKVAAAHSVRSRACERNPKDGVHHPDRLEVLSPCAVFQGTVNETPVKKPDGDISFQVKPDPGYANMLNAHNRSEGGMHVEIVPRDQAGCTPGQPVHFGNVPNLGTCSGRDAAPLALGAHVRIIGPWVVDRNQDENEIHPAWSIRRAR